MRLIGLLNYIYTLKMKTLTLLFSLFLMCPLSVWGQSADELLSKVSDALSEGKDDYAVSLFRQAANAGEDRTEMFYWTNVDKSSEVAPRLADVLAVHYKEMRNYDKAYLFYKEFLQRHPEDVPALVSCAEMEMMRGKEKDALKTYEKVLMLDADNLQANIFLGNYYYLQAEKDKKKLEEDYKKITSPTRMQYARYRNGLSDVFTNSYGKAKAYLYAFSARFIQLLNRKLAYVCIADYYKSEQNVLFCLTLIIIFMKKHFFNATFWALLSLALWTTGCSDDDGYSDVDGQIPTMTLVTDHIESGAGHRFTIEGSLADQDGIVSVNLQCADLYLNKTIDLVEIYGAPQTEYELSYSYDLKRDEIGERFTVKVTVTDAGGREVSQDVLITMDGDFENPTFTIAPGKEVTVLIKDETKFNLNFTVKDDRILDYVLIEIPGVEGFESRRIEAGGQSTLSFTEKIILPNEVKSYDVTLTAVDARGNQTVTNSTISVSEMPDFPKMYLADVATVEELNSDIFGVPMVINHTGEYQYRARYYNKAAGTEIFFLPQKTDFTPICFGLDPEDNTKLLDDPETAKPIVLDEAGVYYEIDINVKESTYSMRTYSVTEATNPMKYEYGKPCFDRWENGESFIDFYIGWGGSPQDAGNQLFAQDKNNPHLFYYPENGTWTLEAGEEMNFIISNYHPDGWWDHVEWRCDDSQNVEKFGYFSKKGDVNPNWEGTNQRWEDGSMVGDNWMKPTVTVTGNYRFEFDAHLGRGKIVPAN